MYCTVYNITECLPCLGVRVFEGQTCDEGEPVQSPHENSQLVKIYRFFFPKLTSYIQCTCETGDRIKLYTQTFFDRFIKLCVHMVPAPPIGLKIWTGNDVNFPDCVTSDKMNYTKININQCSACNITNLGQGKHTKLIPYTSCTCLLLIFQKKP